MRSWFPPFAKCAEDGAHLVIGGDSRSKAGASAIPPPHQDQNPRPVSAKNADTRTGHPPPETDADGKSQADAGGGGTGQGGGDAAGHDSVVGQRAGTRSGRSGRRGGGGLNCSPASAEEVYAAMSMDERVTKTKDLEEKGWIRPGEFEEYLFRDGPDPLRLAEGRLLAASEGRKRSESANSETPEDQAPPPGTIQACRARGARMGRR
jgi:hypothetical protein